MNSGADLGIEAHEHFARQWDKSCTDNLSVKHLEVESQKLPRQLICPCA